MDGNFLAPSSFMVQVFLDLRAGGQAEEPEYQKSIYPLLGTARLGSTWLSFGPKSLGHGDATPDTWKAGRGLQVIKRANVRRRHDGWFGACDGQVLQC